ncbi:hypothetical protein EYF80_004793 [Liparis tanakae]|uniref:Uncharacterized protein n=1 Tax=Liparis tanakae TaxID=230148 RepID=A0A4Z2J4Y3_9TELE|nr:hypothetical protein EYF80_004793 [Liparis tanakae]
MGLESSGSQTACHSGSKELRQDMFPKTQVITARGFAFAMSRAVGEATESPVRTRGEIRQEPLCARLSVGSHCERRASKQTGLGSQAAGRRGAPVCLECGSRFRGRAASLTCHAN